MAQPKRPDDLTYADIVGRANERSLAKTGKPLPLPFGMKLKRKTDGQYRLDGVTGLFKPGLLHESPLSKDQRKAVVNANWRRLRRLASQEATVRAKKSLLLKRRSSLRRSKVRNT